jgi:hypothetical protein
MIDSPEIEHLLALDAMLGYMHRRLANADYSDPFVKGYAQAYSDLAHVRAVVWWDWHQRDPEAAKDHQTDWDAIRALPHLGKHRIFPRQEG